MGYPVTIFKQIQECPQISILQKGPQTINQPAIPGQGYETIISCFLQCFHDFLLSLGNLELKNVSARRCDKLISDFDRIPDFNNNLWSNEALLGCSLQSQSRKASCQSLNS